MPVRNRLAEGDANRGVSARTTAMVDPAMHLIRRRRPRAIPAAGPDEPPICIRDFTVRSPSGLHLRPAALIVRCTRLFDCEIMLHCDGREANARSLLGIVMLQAGLGDPIAVVAKGRNAEAAVAALAALFQSNFGEGADGMLRVAHTAAC